ncbi:MAG: hypothetical protein HKN61_02395, partial [Flavobacteriaceae bacterium]|nr:hypothetical protein [Flavobacteriaceae bacterium]
MKKSIIFLIAVSLLTMSSMQAQLKRELMEKTLTALSDSLFKYYIIEEKARELSAVLEKEMAKGELYQLTTAEEFT